MCGAFVRRILRPFFKIMIEEMIKKIRETEEAAAEKKAQAEEKANEIRRNADAEKARIEDEAAKNARAKSEGIIFRANAKADELFVAEIKTAEAERKEIISEKEKLAADLSAELLKGVKNGDF